MSMRVFNKEKTREIFDFDLEKGYLILDKLLVKTHPAEAEIPAVRHKDVKKFPNGGVSVEWVVDIPAIPAKPEWNEYEDIQVYIPYTEDELRSIRIAEIKKRLSALSEDFIQSFAGAYIEDIGERKKEFANLHNELRSYLGKSQRIYY